MAVLDNLPNGYNVNFHDKIDSTSEEAKRLIESGESSQNLIIIANEQYSGYGRCDKKWESPKGNLYFSLLTKPTGDADKIANISFVTAVALGQALSEFLPNENIQYKWPNDVLIKGKKISGILLEYIPNWLVVGIGVNVKAAPNIENPTTSLKDCGVDNIDSQEFLGRFINIFDELISSWYEEGFAQIRIKWLASAYRLNEEITVNTVKEQLKGVFKGIDEGGNLELFIDNEIRLISSGEVFF